GRTNFRSRPSGKSAGQREKRREEFSSRASFRFWNGLGLEHRGSARSASRTRSLAEKRLSRRVVARSASRQIGAPKSRSVVSLRLRRASRGTIFRVSRRLQSRTASPPVLHRRI